MVEMINQTEKVEYASFFSFVEVVLPTFDVVIRRVVFSEQTPVLGGQVLLLIQFRSMYLQNFIIFPLQVRINERNLLAIFSGGSICRVLPLGCLCVPPHLQRRCFSVITARS